MLCTADFEQIGPPLGLVTKIWIGHRWHPGRHWVLGVLGWLPGAVDMLGVPGVLRVLTVLPHPSVKSIHIARGWYVSFQKLGNFRILGSIAPKSGF